MTLWMIIVFSATLVAPFDTATEEDNGERGCKTIKRGDESYSKSINIPKMKWTETPAVITKGKRNYQVIGRVVHMNYLQEYFAAKKSMKFGNIQRKPNRLQLEVLADTVYIEGAVTMRGIKKLTVYSRKVVSGKDSKLDVRAPTLRQVFSDLAPGTPGVRGESGVAGPKVEVYTQLSEGHMFIASNGGNGNQGQKGADGKNGTDRIDSKPPRTFAECKKNDCKTVWGYAGEKGNPGKDGGNPGKSGDGGEAGKQRLYVNEIKGSIKLKTCPGRGGAAPVKGKGGIGGLGSFGGTGFRCAMRESCSTNLFDPMNPSCHTSCENDGATGRARRGGRGDGGKDGKTEDPGAPGQIDDTYLRLSGLSKNANSKYPLALLKMMKRYAEDRIWANDIEEGKSVLKFLITLMEERKGIKAMKKDSKRKLGFLGKEGFDRFGNNKLFAPLMKWERLKGNAEIIEKYAKEYQDAFNSVTGSIRQKEEITDILKKLIPKATRIQVSNQIKRQKAARAVDESQKRLYVDIIAQVELRLVGTMETIKALLVDLQAQKNMQHLFAMLQGLIGFVSAVGGKDPMGVLSSSFSLIENEALRCNRGTLQQNKAKIKKWLKFGKAYEALEDSSDLNFDKMDIQSVPDMMKADLEINKEGLLADLVCLLDVDLPPHVTATFKSEIEKFFIDGGTRIDLIAQVMELDNNIGTYNYDIANLKETQKQIQAVNKAKDTPIADSIRQEFLDNLLNIYEELETSFSRQLYLFYKGFEFRSLWNMDEKMARFQRRAATLAKGTGYLQGVNSLNRALLEITNIEMAARSCFTSKKPKIGIYKWSFDKMKDPTMFKELYESYTTFTLDIDQACRDCYNVRLLKMYVELYGKAQDQSVPDKVRLKLKPLSRSYFRIGDQIKDFHQPIASWKYLHFDRFKITNKDKCRQEKEHGRDGGFYCMAKHDTRLTEMCCHPLISAPCDDALTGEEECRSVFGTYNISIPIDQTLDCRRQITYKNCKSLKRELFTHMNVWTTFMYWPETYPQTPEDCGIQKRNVTVEADVEELDSPLVLKRDADVN